MNQYEPHLFDGNSGEVEQMLVEISLGEAIERALTDVKSPLSALLSGARADYVSAITALIDADLTTREGIDNARQLQAKAQRYRDLCRYVSEAMEAASRAEEALEDDDASEEPAIEELKDMQHGYRGKPAPDA